MAQAFSQVKTPKIQTNVFDLTHDRKLSTKMGKLTPIMVMDCIPGDQVSINSNSMIRFAPTIAPFMHRVNVYTHFFFVPNRLVWDGWETFITGGERGDETKVWPFIDFDGGDWELGSLPDHLGLPIGANNTGDFIGDISAIPFAAYQLIYDEYYRDQNLEQKVFPNKLADGNNTPNQVALGTLRERSWQHDYFTSALPWTQKGPEAMIPISGEAPIFFDMDADNPQQLMRVGSTGSPLVSTDDQIRGIGGTGVIRAVDPAKEFERLIDLNDTHYADLSQASSTSIIDLRRAMALQRWLEKNARGGSRYAESIQVHFGVQPEDARLQRPEYLGGSKTPVKISEVLQTSQTEDTPQGNMAGHAVSIGGSESIGYHCKEHGYIIGIMSIMPLSSYMQGVPRHFSRVDRFLYFWPELAHIGEQPILQQEIYAIDDDIANGSTFGYTPRYSEYKFIPNTVHGSFRESLDFWHLARKFDGPPALNQAFVTLQAEEVERIFAVQTEGYDNMWCHVLNEVKARRKMPVFSTPRM